MIIILLAVISFCTFLFVMCKYLLKDFTNFIWRKTTSRLPSTFVDLGEYAVTIAFIVTLSILGILFNKFGLAFFAYIVSGDLTSFFIAFRGVFTIDRELQDPMAWQHILLVVVSPAVMFVTFYIIYRSIRTFMSYINSSYGNIYSESDVLYFGFITSILFIFIEILFFSQKIPFVSGLAHFSYLALSKLSAIIYFFAIAHVHQLKNVKYTENLPSYIHLNKNEKSIIYSPKRVILITYLLGLVLYLPFHLGTQFLQNNIAVVTILILFSTISYFVLKKFLSTGFNYLGVVMLAESPNNLCENEKVIGKKTNEKIILSVAIIFILFAIFKVKLFFAVAFIALLVFLSYLIVHTLLYFIGLGFSIIRVKYNKLEPQVVSDNIIKRYLLTTLKAVGKASIPMIGFIFCVLVLFSFYPKKFIVNDDNYVQSVFAPDATPLYIEHTDGNGCIPVSYEQIPEFFLKCLYAQEDRYFTRQKGFLPNISNWHGLSLAALYRFRTGGGGSNINMQLIKNSANVFSKDVQRKIAESLASYQLSTQNTNNDIVTAYLNEVSMNGGINQSGLSQASLYTFGMSITEINPLEMMYLVTTLKRSSTFKTINGTIISYKDAAGYEELIRETLLNRAKSWHEHGLISKNEFNSLHGLRLRFINEKFGNKCNATTNQFFSKHMKASNTVLHSYETNITNSNQQNIGNAVKKFESKFFKIKNIEGCNLYSAALVIDIKTGNIIGHYGGEGVTDLTQFNNGNPIGSIIKPFLLLELLESGFIFEDVKLFDGPIKGKKTPNNSSGYYSNKYVGINEILGKSLNAPMVNIREIADPISMFKSVEKQFVTMGISNDIFLDLHNPQKNIELELNYPLGSRNMTIYDVAQAYQTLFNGGKYIQLAVFSSAYNTLSGEKEAINHKKLQIYSQENSDKITNALRYSMQNEGTGMALRTLLPNNKHFYAKTGTSDKARHGYTVLSDGDTLIVTYVAYGRKEGEHLSLGVIPIPFESGGKSAGVLAALIYSEIQNI